MKWMLWLYLASLGEVALPDPYQQSIQQWQQQRQQNLRKEDGWLTLVGLFWLQPGDNSVGSDPSNALVFPRGPARLGTLRYQEGKVEYESPPGVHQLTIDPEEKEGATIMRWETLSWYLIRRDGRLGVRLKDSQSPTRTGFQGLHYFPIDPAWRLNGRFLPYPEGLRPVRGPSAVEGLDEVASSPGELSFEHAGQTYRLQAQAEEGEEGFFVVFGDQTNGHETYGGGRFLTVDPPDSEGRVVLDFNRAYNPPCVFTNYATCPRPSRQNRLPLEIRAGEKFAGHQPL